MSFAQLNIQVESAQKKYEIKIEPVTNESMAKLPKAEVFHHVKYGESPS